MPDCLSPIKHCDRFFLFSSKVPDVDEGDLHDTSQSGASNLKDFVWLTHQAFENCLIHSKYAKEGSVMSWNLEHWSFNQREWSRRIVTGKHFSFRSDLYAVISTSTDYQERLKVELNCYKL